MIRMYISRIAYCLKTGYNDSILPFFNMFMKPNQEGNTIIILLIVVVVAALIGAGIFFLAPNSGTSTQQAAPQQQDNSLSIGESRPVGDVNDDGVVTPVDVQLVRGQIGCEEGQNCWNEIIGKTLSGDNPIYTMDLDLNNDGMITEEDANEVQKNVVGK